MPTYRGPGGVTEEAASPEEAARKFNARLAASAAPGTPEATRQRDLIGRAKDWLLGEGAGSGEALTRAQSATEPGAFGEAVRGMGHVLLPGSFHEAAVMAALPFAGRMAAVIPGAGLLGGAARSAVRLGVPTAAGATAGAASASQRGQTITEGAKEGALVGLTAAGVAEAFKGTASLLEAAGRRWGHLDTQAFNDRVRTVIGPEVAGAIEKDIPVLAGKVKDISGIIKLQDEATGRKIVAQMFDKTEGRIAERLLGVQFPVEEDIFRLSRGKPVPVATPETVQVGQITQPAAPKPMHLLDAKQTLDVAKRLRSMTFGKNTALTQPAKLEAERLTGEVLQRLQRADPSLATEYEALRQDYRKFMNLRDFIGEKPDKLFPAGGTSAGPTIDLPLFGDRLVSGMADVSPTDFPALHEVFTGPGGPIGTRPFASSLPIFGRARAPVTLPGLGHVTAYEGGRLDTTRLPAHMEPKLAPTLPGRIERVGRAASMIGVPAIAGPGAEPDQ